MTVDWLICIIVCLWVGGTGAVSMVTWRDCMRVHQDNSCILLCLSPIDLRVCCHLIVCFQYSEAKHFRWRLGFTFKNQREDSGQWGDESQVKNTNKKRPLAVCKIWIRAMYVWEHYVLYVYLCHLHLNLLNVNLLTHWLSSAKKYSTVQSFLCSLSLWCLPTLVQTEA